MNIFKVLLLVFGFILTQVTAAANLKELNVLYVKAPFNLQNILMKDKGLLENEFKKDGIKVIWHSIKQGSKQSQALAAGSVDIAATMNTTSFLISNAAGNRLMILTGVARPAELFALVGNKKVQDGVFKGMRVAGPKATVLHHLLNEYLKKSNFDKDDFEFISMTQPAALAALHAGKVDAALLSGGLILKAEEGGFKEIVNGKDLINVNLVSVAEELFVRRHPEVVNTFIRVQRQAIQWLKDHPDEAVKMAAKEFLLTEEQAKVLFEKYKFYTKLTKEDVKAIEDEQVLLKELNLIPTLIDVDSFIYSSATK